jgi:hypothetical protein
VKSYENVCDHSERDRRRDLTSKQRNILKMFGIGATAAAAGAITTLILRKDVSCVYPIFHFRLFCWSPSHSPRTSPEEMTVAMNTLDKREVA